MEKKITSKWLPVVILASYFAMFAISVYTNYIANYNDCFQSKIIFREVFLGLLAGIFAYIVPVEDNVSDIKQDIESYCSRTEKKDYFNKAYRIVNLAILYIIVSSMVYLLITSMQYSRISADYFAIIASYIAAVIMVKGCNYIANKYISTVYAIGVTFINAFVMYGLTDKFYLALIIVAANILLWLISGVVNKKHNVLSVLLGITMIALFSTVFIVVSGKLIAIRFLMMGIGFATGDVGYATYRFTPVLKNLGLTGVVVYSCLLAVVIAMMLIYIIRLYKISKDRALIASGVFLIFLGTVSYGILQEFGILPAATIRVLDFKTDVFMFAWIFRAGVIRPVTDREADDYYDKDDAYYELELAQKEYEEYIEKRRSKDVRRVYKLTAMVDAIAAHIEIIEKALPDLKDEDDNKLDIRKDFEYIKERFEALEEKQ